MNAADRQARVALCGVKLIIVRDDERVTAPNLVLQSDRPDHVIGVGLPTLDPRPST